MQLHELLSTSDIPEVCTLPSIADTDLAMTEVKESCEVDLSNAATIRCTVAFAKGQERSVYFTVYGLPPSELLATTSSKAADGNSAIDVTKFVPVVILAAPSQTHLNAGTVLSVAPLLGTDPAVDGKHPRWLHLHVRPPVRRFVRAIKASEQGNKPLISSWQQLVDGHWVLSFPNEEQAMNAKSLVKEHAARITSLYGNVLSPLLSPSLLVSPPAVPASEQLT